MAKCKKRSGRTNILARHHGWLQMLNIYALVSDCQRSDRRLRSVFLLSGSVRRGATTAAQGHGETAVREGQGGGQDSGFRCCHSTEAPAVRLTAKRARHSPEGRCLTPEPTVSHSVHFILSELTVDLFGWFFFQIQLLVKSQVFV